MAKMRALSSLLALVFATPCIAVPVVGTFEMVVGTGSPTAGVQAGDPIFGSFGYDSDAPLLSESANGGSRYQADFIRVTVGEQTWEIREGVVVRLREDETSGARYEPGEPRLIFEEFEVFGFSTDPFMFPGLGAGSEAYMNMRLGVGVGAVAKPLDLLANEQLPTHSSQINLEQDEMGTTIRVISSGNWEFAGGELASFDLQVVPEPTALTLWILSLHFLVRRRRYRNEASVRSMCAATGNASVDTW